MQALSLGEESESAAVRLDFEIDSPIQASRTEHR
jgi:hypothetical protein